MKKKRPTTKKMSKHNKQFTHKKQPINILGFQPQLFKIPD